MRDDIFSGSFDEPLSVQDAWVPLLSDNTNAAPGVDMPSFAVHRRVSAAVMFFIIRHRRPVPAPGNPDKGDTRASGDKPTLLERAQHLILRDPA